MRAAMARTAAVTLASSGEVRARQAEDAREDGRCRSSRCWCCSRTGRTRSSSSRQGQAFDEAQLAVHARKAAAAIVDAPRDHLEAEARRRCSMCSRGARDRRPRPGCRCCARIRYCKMRALREQAAPARRCARGWAPRTNGRPGAGTAAARCRYSRCLRRRCVPSRSGLRAGCRAPSAACSSSICCGDFLPGEAQIAPHRDQAQADGPARARAAAGPR